MTVKIFHEGNVPSCFPQFASLRAMFATLLQQLQRPSLSAENRKDLFLPPRSMMNQGHGPMTRAFTPQNLKN